MAAAGWLAIGFVDSRAQALIAHLRPIGGLASRASVRHNDSVDARRHRLLRRMLFACASVAVLPYSITVVVAAMFYRTLLYPVPAQFPSEVPEGAELIDTRSSDGVKVRALMFRGVESGPVAVYFHGNGEAMGHDVWIARELNKRGLGVVLAEYRGYGTSQSEGSPTEQGLYADARAVIEAVVARGIATERIILVGHSRLGRASQRRWRCTAATGGLRS